MMAEEPELVPVLPITGKLAAVMISKFCSPPDDGFDRHPLMSIGVSQNSVAATDGFTDVLLGEPDDELVCTKRKEAELEAARAKIFKDVFGASDVPRLMSTAEGEDGVVVPYPDIRGVIDKAFVGMVEIADVHPDALAAVAAIAKAAGVDRVRLFRQSENQLMLGFTFDAMAPDWMIEDLFKPVKFEMPARGVFIVKERARREPLQEELGFGGGKSEEEDDPMWEEVVRYSVETGQISTSMIQRKFRLGFQRASLLLDTMEKKGVIEAKDGPRPRTVLIGMSEVEEYI